MINEPFLSHQADKPLTITDKDGKYTVTSHRNLAFLTGAAQDEDKKFAQDIAEKVLKNSAPESETNPDDKPQKLTIKIDKSPSYLAMTKNDVQRFLTKKGLASYFSNIKEDTIEYFTLAVAVMPAAAMYFLEDALELVLLEYFLAGEANGETKIGSAIAGRTLVRWFMGAVLGLNAINFSWHEFGSLNTKNLTKEEKTEIIKTHSLILQAGFNISTFVNLMLMIPIPTLLLVYKTARFPGEAIQACYYLAFSTAIEQTLKSWLYATDQAAIAANHRGSRLIVSPINIVEKILEAVLAAGFLYKTRSIMSLPAAACIAAATALSVELLYLSQIARIISLSELLGIKNIARIMQHIKTKGFHETKELLALISPAKQLKLFFMLCKRGFPIGASYFIMNFIFPLSLAASTYVAQTDEAFINALDLKFVFSVGLFLQAAPSFFADAFSTIVSKLLATAERPHHRIKQFGHLALILMLIHGTLAGSAMFLLRNPISRLMVDKTITNYEEAIQLLETLLIYMAPMCVTELARHTFSGLIDKFSPTTAGVLNTFSMFIVSSALMSASLLLGLGAKGTVLSIAISSTVGMVLNAAAYTALINKKLPHDIYTTKTITLSEETSDNNEDGNKKANIEVKISAPVSILQCVAEALNDVFKQIHPNPFEDNEITTQEPKLLDQPTNPEQINASVNKTTTPSSSWRQSITRYKKAFTQHFCPTSFWGQPTQPLSTTKPPSPQGESYGTADLTPGKNTQKQPVFSQK